MADYATWQSKTIAQLSEITDAVTDADKAYMEGHPFDQLAAIFDELGTSPSGSLADLTSRLSVSIAGDGTLVSSEVVDALAAQNLSVNDIIVLNDTIFNTVTYSWPGADGNINQVLQTDSAGNLTWTDQIGGGIVWTQSSNDIYYPASDGATGNVGISTTTPAHRLHIKATQQDLFRAEGEGGDIFFRIDTFGNVIRTGTTPIFYVDNSITVANNVDVGSGNFIVTGSSGNTNIAGTLDVVGHSAFGSGASVDSSRTINIDDTISIGAVHYGIRDVITSSSGATFQIGHYISTSTSPAAITVTYQIGLYVASGTKGVGSTISNRYGIYIDNDNLANTNWSIYSVGNTPSFLGGELGIAYNGGSSFTPTAGRGIHTRTDSGGGGIRVETTDTNNVALEYEFYNAGSTAAGRIPGIFRFYGAGNLYGDMYVEVVTASPAEGKFVLRLADAGSITSQFEVDNNGDVSGRHGTYHTTSDMRLKTNVYTIDYALMKVIAMRGVYYDWIKPKPMRSGRQIGMLAQEVGEIVPELINIADDAFRTQSIKDDISIDGLLVEAIKELNSKLEDEASVLRGENQRMKKQIELLIEGR